MIRNLPEDIIVYLIEKLPPFTGVFMANCNGDGELINYYGPYKDYLLKKPKKGKQIHEYVPALFSMIPPLVSPMVLTNIQLVSGSYTDIHILENKENEYWIFFVDQSNNVKGIRNILQKMNEEKYDAEINTNHIESPMEVFEELLLKVESNNIALLKSKIPHWFKELAPGNLKNTKINFTETFPFLEVFLFEANEFWNTGKPGKIKSGIWTQLLPNKTEISFVAYAIYHTGQKYLVVRPIEEDMNSEQLALQMAREQKLAYEKLEKAEKKLKLLLEYKDKFVGIVSHDLRSPVAAVLGITELLTNDKEELSKLSDFYQDMIINIKEEMERLLEYNDKLYHWSNLELGNFDIVKKPESLLKIIQTSERTSESKLKSKNITFQTNITGKNDFKIKVDLTLFLQVLNNLVSNAVKFTPENGTITINAIRKENRTTLTISDTGVGIPKTISEKIFEGFARNSTHGTSGEKGTGLGLGIVKKIIDAHGFTIDVNSEEGKGSDFIININN